MAENLPGVPREDLTLLQRLSSKEYKKAMEEAATYRANLEQVMAAVNATEEALTKREEAIEENAKERATELDKRAAALDAKKAELDKMEKALAEKEAASARRIAEAEAAIASRTAETSQKADKVGVEKNEFEAEKLALVELLNKVAAKDGADPELIAGVMSMLENLRPQKTTEKTISEKSLTRDDIVMQTIMTIKQQATELDYVTKLKINQGMTTGEQTTLILQKANLRAALLAAVCFYRDSLPEVDRLSFSINGQSCAKFLQEQAIAISEETRYNRVAGGPISKEALEIIDSTYKRLASSLNLRARSDGASYDPFHYNLGITDTRRAGPKVFEKCYDGANRGIDLIQEDGRIPRATTDVKAPSSLEAEITDTAKIVEEDWEK